MADIRISQLPAKAANLQATDLYVVAIVDASSATGYTTKYVTGQEIINGVGALSSVNLYNTNGTLTSDREVEMAGNGLSFKQGGTTILTLLSNGQLSFGGVTYPAADGTTGQVLTTNGAGVASWSTPSASEYFKAEILINSGSISASNSDQAVIGLTYTIPSGKNGDYVIYAVISADIDNSDMRPMALMIYKNGVKESNSVTMDFAKKNENQSVQLTFAMDGLVATDVVAIYVNNDNEDINDIIVGRILAQKFV